MRSLFGIINTYKANSSALVLMVLAVMIVTILVYVKVRKIAFASYIPGAVFLLIGLFNLIPGFTKLTTPEGLSGLMNFVVFFVSGFVGIMISVICHQFPIKAKVSKRRPKQPKDVEEVK